MTNTEIKRLTDLRALANSNWGNLLTEEMVKELRELEHKAAVRFAKKMGCKLEGV